MIAFVIFSKFEQNRFLPFHSSTTTWSFSCACNCSQNLFPYMQSDFRSRTGCHIIGFERISFRESVYTKRNPVRAVAYSVSNKNVLNHHLSTPYKWHATCKVQHVEPNDVQKTRFDFIWFKVFLVFQQNVFRDCSFTLFEPRRKHTKH